MPAPSSEPSVPQEAPSQVQPAEVQPAPVQPVAPETSNNTPVENQAQTQDSPATQENKGSLKDSFNSGVQKAKDA